MTQQEKIDLWEKVMGMRTDEGDVDNLFMQGEPCDKLYERISDAEHRLMGMLNVEENDEIDEIFACWMETCKLVSLRMFDYGMEAVQ